MSSENNTSVLSNLFNSAEFKDNIKNLAKTYALPALAATAGSGVLGGVLASKNEIPFESNRDRRMRILRSALFPALTTAGALTLLGGAAALSDVDTGKIDEKLSGVSLFDRLVQASPYPLGIGGGLAWAAKPQLELSYGKKNSKEFKDLLKKVKNAKPEDTEFFNKWIPHNESPFFTFGNKEVKILPDKSKNKLVKDIQKFVASHKTPKLRFRNTDLGKIIVGLLSGSLAGYAGDIAVNKVLY